jgi:hypothetical protein
MSLHAKNIAVMAGAQGTEIEKLADQLVSDGKIKLVPYSKVTEGKELDNLVLFIIKSIRIAGHPMRGGLRIKLGASVLKT